MSDPTDPTIRLRRGSYPRPTSGRALGAAAATGGAVAAAATLAVCMSLALTAWFLADAGSHGETTDALRAGADAWLVGHGSHFVLNGMPLGITPLALTMILVLGSFRAGRWSARRAVGEVVDEKVLAMATAAFAGAYVVIAVVVCVLASQTGAEPGLGRSVLGAVAVSAVGGGLGLAVGTGRWEDWLGYVPAWVREVVVGAAAGALLLLAAGAVLVTVALLLSFNEASSVLTVLDLSTGDAITYTLVMALLAPNIALFGSAYLIGPGFAIGTGTSVSTTAPVVIGAVPAFPILAALPDQGAVPGWLPYLMVVPALCAACGVALAGRGSAAPAYDLAALRGAGAGAVAGVLITLAIGLSGGPMGTDRLRDIGAESGPVFLLAVGTMLVGGLLGGVAAAWWRRRGTSGPDHEDTITLSP